MLLLEPPGLALKPNETVPPADRVLSQLSPAMTYVLPVWVTRWAFQIEVI